MTDNERTTEDVLDAVRRAVAGVAPADHAAASLPKVVAAGQSRRRRRRLAGGCLACAGLALGAVLAGTVAQPGAGRAVALPGAGPAGRGASRAAGGASVSLAAWSVHVDSDGTVTIDMNSFTDLGQLQRVLAADGVPAMMIPTQQPCSADTAPNHNEMLNDRNGSVPTPSQPVALPGGRGLGTIEVDPAWLPRGYELSFRSGIDSHGPDGNTGEVNGYPGPGQGGYLETGIIKTGNYPDCG
jgi:hypothetical protein